MQNTQGSSQSTGPGGVDGGAVQGQMPPQNDRFKLGAGNMPKGSAGQKSGRDSTI